ncbi:MAG: hypothetical protein FRX48_08089 [Lasallia pustulata]|uniref:Uncharacterized protein n=1 Tax=Lasallia pustulata TaxID=136370 RepID=A0A5M8PG76_9LECA|nr:MAG: hypothetical protein FRX48_08089 [Lasallia pustulata]
MPPRLSKNVEQICLFDTIYKSLLSKKTPSEMPNRKSTSNIRCICGPSGFIPRDNEIGPRTPSIMARQDTIDCIISSVLLKPIIMQHRSTRRWQAAGIAFT